MNQQGACENIGVNSGDNRDHEGSLLELPRLLLRAFLRRIGVYRIRAEKDLQAVVISPGGVGTTMLIEHMGKFLRVNRNDDGDHLKHVPRLPHRLPGGLKILFVHGDADDVVASIRRRGWIPRHGSKLGSVGSVVGFGGARLAALRAAVIRQIDWFQANPRPDVMLIRYEELWDQTDRIAEFLGISDRAFVKDFPTRRRRTGAPAEASPPTAPAGY